MSWESVKLGTILTIATGKYDVNHSTEDGIYPFFTCAMLPFKSNTFSFDDEVILLPGNGANVGEVMYYKGKLEAYQRTYVLHKINANVKYVFYFLKAHWKISQSNQQYGSATNYIRLDNITDLQIPLPPLSIQKRIAAILDAADALRRKDQELLKKYDELAKAIFINMFGDPVRNEKGWDEDLIKNIASKEKHSIKAGPFGSSLKKEFYTKSGYKIYGQEQVIADNFAIGDYYIDEEKFQALKNCSIKEDDILISLVGTYGKISVVPKNIEKGIINPRLMKISLDRKLYNPYFFKYLLQTKQMYDRISTFSRGGTMDIVNVGIISEVVVIIPPISAQDKFVDSLNNLKEQAQKIKFNETSNKLFNSLIHKAFKGELTAYE